VWYKNIAGRFFELVTKHACDRRTDGRTVEQNYDSQDRTRIAASRGENDMTFYQVVRGICIFSSLNAPTFNLNRAATIATAAVLLLLTRMLSLEVASTTLATFLHLVTVNFDL